MAVIKEGDFVIVMKKQNDGLSHILNGVVDKQERFKETGTNYYYTDLTLNTGITIRVNERR